MADTETMELACLGRPFQLGMLYDCRSDKLIPGITLWDCEVLKNNIQVSPQPNTDFKIITSDSSEDKSEALNVSASLEASFLGGLVSVKGSAEYMHDKKTSKHQSRVTLQYSTTTRFEQLTMDHLGKGNVQHSNVFNEGSATHVVTALLYGAQAFFVFDRQVSSGENHQEIHGSLQACIKKIPLISIEGQASLKMTEEERKQTNTFNCTFHGDFALENNPVSFQDAMKVYADLPRLLGEHGERAKPMTVWLYPLKNLDSAAAQLVRQISVSLVKRAQRIIGTLDNVDIQCQDMRKEDMAIEFPEITAKLNKFKDLCSEYKLVFQKELCKHLPKIRGGGAEEEELIKVVCSKERSPFQDHLLTTYLNDREREMNILRSYLDIMKEVQVVTSSSELDRMVLDQANHYVVCFAFTSLKEKEDYIEDLENFLSQASKSDSSHVIYDPNEPEKSTEEKWFHSKEVSTQTRQNIRLFLDFKEANKDREHIAFCIASIPNNLLPASSIFVYERGILLSDKFELPSKPGFPTILNVEHNCVHLQVKPPNFGVDFVKSYHIFYQAKETDSEWTEVNAVESSQPIRHLKPNVGYQFSCKAVCKPGVTLASDLSEYIKTRPCSPPGQPSERSVDAESIKVTWDIPTMVGEDVEVMSYTVEYREGFKDADSKMWHSIKAITRECTLQGLNANTAYIVRVSANCGVNGTSLPSQETALTTAGAFGPQSKETSSEVKSEQFLNLSEKLQKGNPSVHKLTLGTKYGDSVSFKQFTFGKKVEKTQNKVVLLLGATGAGKTTLINVMINSILGVTWEDRYRFKLIHEVTHRSQAESQTSIVTSYELYNQPGFQIPYSLTIIDTPGFGDTRGLAHDKLITEQVKEFLCSPLGVDHIDAICFVVQASLARLSATQKYIFDSIMAIFGKDVAENILLLVTFADGKDVPVLGAIQAADLPCHKNKKGLPTHFKFNNSMLFTQKTEDTHSNEEDSEDEDTGLDKIIWGSTFKQMKAFFKTLASIKSKDLTMTKQVLEERERLERAMARLAPQITAGLTKMTEIKQFKQCLENEGENMRQNQNFETEVEVLEAKRTKLNSFATNCIVCKFTCHTSCYLPDGDDIKTCAVMDDDGKCVMCPGNCAYFDHDREKALWTYETKTEKKTIKELKDNFMNAQGKFMSTKQMLEELEDEFCVIQDKLMYLIKMSSNCLKRLNDIALKQSSLSTVEYIDLLIRTEEDERKPGFEDRIIGLRKMKQESEILEKLAKGITLWDCEVLKNNIQVSPQPNTDFKIITSDSSEDKSEALNVSASLEASFLGGLVSVKGSAEYMHDKKTSKHQSRVTLQYSTTTRFEQLTMDHLGKGNVQHSNVFNEGSATHVVTALLYGAQAFFVFDRQVSSGENHQEIHGSLQACIKKIPLISIEGQASLKMTEEERKQTNTFNCTFHGDFALENNPVSFQDAMKVYADLPRLLGEHGERAKPMTVWLYPLKNLDSAAAQLVRQISVSLVKRAQRIIGTLDNVDIQCQDMRKEDMAIEFPEITAKLNKFKDLCSEYKLVFQKELCKHLPKIRGGGAEEEELIKVVCSKERSPFQDHLLTTYLNDREREMNILRSYLDIMKEVQVVTSSSELDRMVLDQANHYVVCFAFTSLKEKEDYIEDLENFLSQASKSDSSHVIYDPNEPEKSTEEKWFHSKEVSTQTRQNIRLFLDFKEANKDREHIAFCIASIPNNLLPASSIFVYERGILLSDKFELPSKPGFPTILNVEHNCVHLQVKPPNFGVDFVKSYHIFYQAKETDSEWTEVNAVESSQPIRHLKPNVGYQFSCKAVCKPGVTLASDLSEYIKTRPCSPPGQPSERSVDAESIKVTWDT